jgi:glycosyltransferase involved in cell wall biosynthesis
MSLLNEIRSESEIIRSWGQIGGAPVVSICCFTYNHGKFIEDSIKGFLSQQTSFPFEIIIHDDASTDNTQEIIKSYEKLYPQIIKSVLQTNNQHSLGIWACFSIYDLCRGKYIALCEGDDYWLNEKKLESQVQAFKLNPSLAMIFHKAIQLDIGTGRLQEICAHYNKDSIIKAERCLKGGGEFMPTASIMHVIPRDKFLVDFLKKAPVGDYFIQSYFALVGQVYYLNISASCYRTGVKGSWTSELVDIEKEQLFLRSMIVSLDEFYGFTMHYKRSSILIYPASDYIVKYLFKSNGIIVKFEKLKDVLNICSNFNFGHLFFIVTAKIIVMKLRGFVTGVRRLLKDNNH